MLNLKKKPETRDIAFAAVVILLTALFMLLPSRVGGKGTSPGQSALNAILLSSQCSDILYDKFESTAKYALFGTLVCDLDFAGEKFWSAFIREKYGK